MKIQEQLQSIEIRLPKQNSGPQPSLESHTSFEQGVKILV